MRIETAMTSEAYFADEHISRSTAHRYRGKDGGRAQRYQEVLGRSLFSGSASTAFGTAVDIACGASIERVEWRSRLVVPPTDVLSPDGHRRGKNYTNWKEQIQPGACEVSRADYEKIAEIVDALHEHNGARSLIEATTHSQYSVFWTDAEGHKRKARADGVTPSEWWDLKTTSSDWKDMKFSFLKYGYTWQSAWYSDASAATGLWSPYIFRFVVVQTFAPYDVRIYYLSEDVVDQAREEISKTLGEMRSRDASGVYVPESYHESIELVF